MIIAVSNPRPRPRVANTTRSRPSITTGPAYPNRAPLLTYVTRFIQCAPLIPRGEGPPSTFIPKYGIGSSWTGASSLRVQPLGTIKRHRRTAIPRSTCQAPPPLLCGAASTSNATGGCVSTAIPAFLQGCLLQSITVVHLFVFYVTIVIDCS
jgi:hypothetical protein